MKGIRFIVLLFFFTLSVFAAEKRYEVKSGLIEYDINGKGTNMGVSSSIKGTGELFFKDYGNLEIEKESFIENIMGQEQKSEEFSKYDNGVVYSVDYEENIIYKQDISKLQEQETYSLMGEEGLQKMGAVKTGSETILGYKCDIWQLHGVKLSLYKGVPLKIETQTMGIVQIQVATKAHFNISLSDSKFNLPSFPIKDMSDMMEEDFQPMEMKMEGLPPEQQEMMKQMMQNLENMKNNYKQ